jgi:hypothetical protein
VDWKLRGTPDRRQFTRPEADVHGVVEEAVRGIDQDGSVAQAWKEMNDAGVQICSA